MVNLGSVLVSQRHGENDVLPGNPLEWKIPSRLDKSNLALFV